MRQTTLGLSLAAALVLAGSAFAQNPCTTSFAVDPRLMNLVMPNAKIMAGANVTSAISSPLGQFLVNKLAASGNLQNSPFAALGFNPIQDVTEILAATSADKSSPGGLVLMLGTFPVNNLVALAQSGGNTKWQVTNYGGATLFTNTNANGKVTIAFAFPPSNSILIAGDLPSVKAAIDQSAAGSSSIDPGLAQTVNQLSCSEDEWVASSASLASLLPPQPNSSTSATGPFAQVLPLLQSIQGFSGGVKLGDPVALTGEAVENSPQNANALNAVIKLGLLMVGSVSTGQQGNQELASLLQLLQTMQVTTSGSNVDLSLTIPESQIESLLNNVPFFKVSPAALKN